MWYSVYVFSHQLGISLVYWLHFVKTYCVLFASARVPAWGDNMHVIKAAQYTLYITNVRAGTEMRLLEPTWNQWQPMNCEKQLGGFSDYNVGRICHDMLVLILQKRSSEKNYANISAISIKKLLFLELFTYFCQQKKEISICRIHFPSKLQSFPSKGKMHAFPIIYSNISNNCLQRAGE